MPKLNRVEPPKDERPYGEATFNYESYDGRFVIGAEPWSFETSWTGAGPGAAYIYNDPSGIEGVAIAEGITAICQVTPNVVAEADFTSRARTVGVGQVVLLRNAAGFYAAVQPLEISYSRLPSGNVMRMRFVIQSDGSRDFAPFASKFDDRQILISQLLVAATEAEHMLRAVPVAETTVGAIGIGHNQPPADFALTESDRNETLEAIAAIRQEASSADPSISKLRFAGQTFARKAGKVAEWLVHKLNTASDEFAKTLGKTMAVSVVGGLGAIGVWTALQDKLTSLAELVSKFIAQ